LNVRPLVPNALLFSIANIPDEAVVVPV
jgi:hypothetical protein